VIDNLKIVADKELADKRMEVCKSCEHFVKFTTQCKRCGCITKLKTKLANQHCPLGKW